jgi:hypothetical protein
LCNNLEQVAYEKLHKPRIRKKQPDNSQSDVMFKKSR